MKIALEADMALNKTIYLSPPPAAIRPHSSPAPLPALEQPRGHVERAAGPQLERPSGRGPRRPLEWPERAPALLERPVRAAAVEQPAGPAAAVGSERASLPHAASATFPRAVPPPPAAAAVQPAAAATAQLRPLPAALHAGGVSPPTSLRAAAVSPSPVRLPAGGLPRR